MKRTHLFIMSSLIFLALMLSSCFIPDNYEAEVIVHKDGSYDFIYEGELNFAPALQAVIEGTFDEEDKEDMMEIIEDLKDEPGFETVKNLGKGKIKVGVEISMNAGEDYDFISDDIKIFSIRNLEDGTLLITGLDYKKSDLEPLKDMGITMNGELTVAVEKGVKVKSQNADMKKKFDKNMKAYLWELDMDSDKPEMIIKK